MRGRYCSTVILDLHPQFPNILLNYSEKVLALYAHLDCVRDIFYVLTCVKNFTLTAMSHISDDSFKNGY